ncbi:MAG: ABC transporter substrate-binding protein [Burkholderiales bacterium]|nr:ABC transporter substrate-binding protein [Anaerolineae bacterium]
MNTWLNAVVGARCIVPLRVTLLICLALLVQPIAAQEECVPADGEPIVLGAIFPEGNLLTRRDGDAYQGAEAMRQAINACGGVNGHPVEFMYEPANDRDDAAEAAQHLIDAGVPLIVGSGSQAVSEGAREVTEAAGVVFWEMTEALDDAGEWSFSSRPTNEFLGSRTAQIVTALAHPTLGITDGIQSRIALVYEDRPRGQQVASGVLQALGRSDQELTIEYPYSDTLFNAYELAERIRDEDIDILILSMFDEDAENLWYALREANASVGAWIHIGSQGYHHELCERGGNMQGFISVDASGPVNDEYRREAMGELYTQYLRAYLNENGTDPDVEADLSASGVYLLWRYILPFVDGAYIASTIRSTIVTVRWDLTSPNAAGGATGMMSQGGYDVTSGGFVLSDVIVRQQQGSFFCSVWPEEIATCAVGVQPFPTWRERALLEQNPAICTGDGI